MKVVKIPKIRRLLGCLIACLGCWFSAQADGLIINEIQVANIDMFIDPSFNYGGWIELYNPTEEAINIYSYYVSDDPTNRKKFKLPVRIGSVPAGGYKCVWFDHHTTAADNSMSANAYKQVDFKLSYEGGTIYLYDQEERLVAQQDYPPAIPRCSYARTTDGGDTWSYCSTPTPEETNAGSSFASSQLPPPVVDRDGCLFTSPFNIKVTIPTGCALYYTTDGSTPTLTNGKRNYSGQLHVSANQNTVYRFRLFRDGYLPSPVVTRSYIYKDRDYYLPVISVVTDSKNLYDDKIGVYVDGTNGISGNNKNNSNKNRAWERPVNFEYFVPDAEGNYDLCAVNQETDFEVCGGWSRHFSPSSFRIKAVKQYEGNNFLPYPFFPANKPYIKNKSLQVRNGGNDTNSRILDAAIQQIIIRSGFYLDCQDTQPAHVFFNGVFQYTYNIREPANKNLCYSNYGIDKDEVDEFEINAVQGYYQKSGDNQAMMQWISLAQQLANKPSDHSIYEKICELVDIDEYTNFMAAGCYIGCSDWLTNCNNVKGFRSQAEGGKFHLVLMDQDAGFAYTDMISRLQSHLSDSRYSTGRSYLIDIFLNMLKYEPFKKRLIDAYCIVGGSIFTPERSNAIVNEMANLSSTALSWEGHSPWGSANSLISRFNNSSDRNARFNSLRNYLKLSEPYTVNLSSELPSATLRINGQEVPTGHFSGPLFAPINIQVEAPAGYRFAGWKSDGTFTNQRDLINLSTKWSYYDQGSLDGEDWTSVSYSTSGWQSAEGPYGYGTVGIEPGTGDYTTTLDYGGDSSNKRPTYYFRRNIYLNDPLKEGLDALQLTYYVDDGCVIYVNGTELTRYHMPEGTPTYNQYSTTYEGNTAYAATVSIPLSMLRLGKNVIAVEVHNTSASSSDIYFGAELSQGTFQVVDAGPEVSLEELGDVGTYGLVALFEPVADEERLTELAAPIKVNEVGAGNSVFINDYFKKNDWFELYNPTDIDLNVAGLYVSDTHKDPYKYQIPTTSPINTIVPAHGHLILWADKLEDKSQLHTPFKLSNTYGSVVVVTSSDEFVAANEEFFQQHPKLRTFSDVLTYEGHDGDQSVGRYPDGANTFYLMQRPTPGKPNSLRTYDEVIGTDKGIPTDIRQDEELASNPADSEISGYYTISGIYLGTDPKALRPGIYVIRFRSGVSKKWIKS
ncbi:MAG: lamin tail domain-containing protein [Bacteroidaceae bacterium]|nr:lamin tail domain-containing protein [Bacteroidaceae bacterium]